jgi:hypothetical protein
MSGGEHAAGIDVSDKRCRNEGERREHDDAERTADCIHGCSY